MRNELIFAAYLQLSQISHWSIAEIQSILTLFTTSKNSYHSQSYNHQTEKSISKLSYLMKEQFCTLFKTTSAQYQYAGLWFSLIRTLQCQMRNERFFTIFARALLPWQRRDIFNLSNSTTCFLTVFSTIFPTSHTI